MDKIIVPFPTNIVFEHICGPPKEKTILLNIYTKLLDLLVKYSATYSDLFPAKLVDVKVEDLTEELSPKQKKMGFVE